jgi:hypothetical protein
MEINLGFVLLVELYQLRFDVFVGGLWPGYEQRNRELESNSIKG